jgi:hypothetical protein
MQKTKITEPKRIETSTRKCNLLKDKRNNYIEHAFTNKPRNLQFQKKKFKEHAFTRIPKRKKKTVFKFQIIACNGPQRDVEDKTPKSQLVKQ